MKLIKIDKNLREVFEVNYLRGKYNQRSEAPLMPSIVLCILL